MADNEDTPGTANRSDIGFAIPINGSSDVQSLEFLDMQYLPPAVYREWQACMSSGPKRAETTSSSVRSPSVLNPQRVGRTANLVKRPYPNTGMVKGPQGTEDKEAKVV